MKSSSALHTIFIVGPLAKAVFAQLVLKHHFSNRAGFRHYNLQMERSVCAGVLGT